MTDIPTHRLTPGDCALVVIDVQERLMRALPEAVRERTLGRIRVLLEASRRLDIPVLATEQYPKGLGPTVPEIAEAIPDFAPVSKMTFSCCGAESFLPRLKELDRHKILLAGVETHVCCLQTALDLLENGFIVHFVADALASREKLNWRVGLTTMEQAGALPTTTEQALFELLREAGTEDFKALSRLIK